MHLRFGALGNVRSRSPRVDPCNPAHIPASYTRVTLYAQYAVLQEAAATALTIADTVAFACATGLSNAVPSATDDAKLSSTDSSLVNSGDFLYKTCLSECTNIIKEHKSSIRHDLHCIFRHCFGIAAERKHGIREIKSHFEHLRYRPDSVADVSALKITTSIKNTGTEALRLLNDPNSALSSWETDGFQIARAESSLVSSPALNFTGIRVKYSPAAAVKAGNSELFTIIEPGATVNITHPLGSTYDFSGKGGGAGKYKLRASARARTFLSVGADGSITSLEATEEKVAEVAVSGRLSGPKLQPGSRGAARGSGTFESGKSTSKRALFRGCNNDQIGQINAAAASADNMAHGAHGFLRDGPWGTRRYTEWFGAWDTGRYNTVFRHYDAIRFNPPTFSYDCTCTDNGIYAYVIIPGHFKEVYLCGAFWRAPLEGTDSKAGTIIHEASHFPEYAGTSDHAYGQGAARDLARNDPGRAVMNADSHEYFAENVPWLGQ